MFVWIWTIRNIGTPEEVVQKLKELNISNVCLKYHDGNGGLQFRDAFLEYMPILKQNNIKVGAWGYNYFNYPEEEAALVIEALNNGADYYIFDGEVELEQGKKYQETDRVMQIVRQAFPNALLGYCPFPYVHYHEDYPYGAFEKYCDFVSPQCYSNEIGTDLGKCLDITIKDFDNYGYKLPVYPSIEGYKISYEDYNLMKQFDNWGVWVLDLMTDECKQWLKDNLQKPEDSSINQQYKMQIELEVTEEVEVKELPDQNAASIKTFHKGDKITAIDISEDGVFYLTTIGWVMKNSTKPINYPYPFCKEFFVRNDSTAVYDKPNGTKEIRSFKAGDKITSTNESTTEKWYQVIINGQEGWIKGEDLKI